MKNHVRKKLDTKFFVFVSAVFLSSCATQKNTYRFQVGTRVENYVENPTIPLDQSLAQSLGGTVTTISGNPNQIASQAIGLQVGLVEETKENITTTLSVYSNSYSPVSYAFNSSTYGLLSQNMAVTGTGFDATLGFNLLKGNFRIRPGLSYKIENQQFIVTGTGAAAAVATFRSYNQSVFVWGAGAAFEYAFSKSNRLALQLDYRVPSRSVQGVSSLSYTSMQLSWLTGDW